MIHIYKQCIVNGIPLLACESTQSHEYSMEEFVQLKDRQIGTIDRMLQNYEHAQAIKYAAKTFPEHKLHVCLIGMNHAHTYTSLNNSKDKYPGIVDITNGIYVETCDIVYISQESFINELQLLGTVKAGLINTINDVFFKNKKMTRIDNIKQVIQHMQSEGLLITPLIHEEEIDNKMKALCNKHYIKLEKEKMATNLLEGYNALKKELYLIQAQTINEIIENETHNIEQTEQKKREKNLESVYLNLENLKKNKEQFIKEIKKIEKKYKNNPQKIKENTKKYIDAINAIDNINNKINELSKNYISGTYLLASFKKDAKIILNDQADAKELKTHRGIKQDLLNLLAAILIVGIIHHLFKGNFTLFPSETKSSRLIADLDQSIQDLKKNGSVAKTNNSL